MDVKFVSTTAAKLGSIAIQNGQIIALSDTEGMYYDLGGARHNVMRPGTSSQGGRVKLTDIYTSSQGTADSSVAASSYALSSAYNALVSDKIKYSHVSSNDISYAGGATTPGQILASASLNISGTIGASTTIVGVTLLGQAYNDRYTPVIYSISSQTIHIRLLAVGTYTNPFTTQVQAKVLYK